MILLAMLSFLLLAYTLVGYPLVMHFFARFRPMPVTRGEELPPLSVIVCCKDEENNIAKRLDNLLALDYPPELLEIIIVSDGSGDATPRKVEEYAQRGVKMIHYPESMGKAYALNQGVQAAANEILLMGDARQTFLPDVAAKLVPYFSDESVGAVSGRLAIRPRESEASARELGTYWDLEVWLRQQESLSGSVVGVTGAIYALRKSCFVPLPVGTVLDDVLIPMRAVMGGKRVLFEAEAIAVDEKTTTAEGELRRKSRTLYGNLQLFDLDPSLFNPAVNPVWWQFVSHKILRLFLPLMFAMCCLFCLFAGGAWSLLGILQLAGWCAAVVSLRFHLQQKPMKILATLLLLNISVINAWRFYFGKNDSVWDYASSNEPGIKG